MQELPSLYKQYVEERCPNRFVIETLNGFVLYEIQQAYCYIIDIFVTKEARKKGVARFLNDEVVKAAKAKDCKVLLGSIDPQANGADTSFKVLLAGGFKPTGIKDNLVFFAKEI